MKGKYAVKQISIFLENRRGRLADVAKTLSLADINIRALFLADSSEFGILRLVVNNPEKAKAVLLANNFAATETEVFAAEVEDRPGGFYKVVKILAERNIDIEYTYAYAGSSEKAILFFKVESALFEKAVKALEESGVKLLEAASVYK
ncbi:acetolactate synthase [Desulfurobacterium sp.]